MKICNVCGIVKPFSEFNKNKAKKDGYGTRCRECMKLYRKQYYIENRDVVINKVSNRKSDLRQWISELKETFSCLQCGENHIAVLDFHHRDPNEKEISISLALNHGYGKKRLEQEMKKCDILCSNCHRKTHWNMRV